MADLKSWQFPKGIGNIATNKSQPYMILTSYESQNAIHSVGHDTEAGPIPISSIALYIPPNSLRQTTTSNWGGTEGAALLAGAGGALDKISQMIVDPTEEGGPGAGTVLGNVLTSMGMTAQSRAAKMLDKQTGMLSAGAGIAVNNHMAMVYKGPGEFRTHEFAFNFFPKNRPDADVIKNILDDFQRGMLPKAEGTSVKNARTLSRPYFHSPRHWNIEFYKGNGKKNDFLFNIKKSVITSMTVNHDPNSTISLHADGSPVQTAFSLTFQEIELPISGDTLSKRQEEQRDALLQAQANRDAPVTGIVGPAGRAPSSNPNNPFQGKTTLGLTIPSDFRLKDNITLLQGEGFGIPNIYSFNYKWDAETTWIGVMAQELLDTGYSDAVGTDLEGFYNVDYSKLGFPMIGFK